MTAKPKGLKGITFSILVQALTLGPLITDLRRRSADASRNVAGRRAGIVGLSVA